MKINYEHLYHGAALNQIAEHPDFTAINGLRRQKVLSRSAFIVNNNIGVYLKYATKPVGAFDEYRFTFHFDHQEELRRLKSKCDRVFLVLVCVQDKHICCLPYHQFRNMVERRRKDAGHDEDQYQIQVVLPPGKSFRAYINSKGTQGWKLGEQIINRNAFPACLFD